MRYLTLAEAMVVAEAATGIEVRTLAQVSRIDLLDSALHAPRAGFGDEEFYPSLTEKAAMLAVRIARNHPLPDGNKRLAWQALTLFLALNQTRLDVSTDEAVDLMVAIAAGERDERRSLNGLAVGSIRLPSTDRDVKAQSAPVTEVSFGTGMRRREGTGGSRPASFR